MRITRLVFGRCVPAAMTVAIVCATYVAAWSPEFANSQTEAGRSAKAAPGSPDGGLRMPSLHSRSALPTTHDEKPCFVGLGDLPDGRFDSVAAAVSEDGRVVVGHSNTECGHEAFHWTLATGMTPLGFLEATGVSADGSSVVGYRLLPSDSEAVAWTARAGTVALEKPPELRYVDAMAISADGSVIVGSYGNVPRSEAIYWTHGEGKVHRLGCLPGGQKSAAYDVSADGSLIVGRSETATGFEAFRWTETDGMVGLGTLPDTVASEARAVSRDGSVIVGGGGGEAFRWTEQTGMVGLGGLSGYRVIGLANGVSADGSVVVGMDVNGFGPEAFIWDAAHKMRSVHEVLEKEPGLAEQLSGWNLTSATAISADGRVVVGWGTSPHGDREAWMARLGNESRR